MNFTSEELFSWDAEGNINSTFAWHPSDEVHEVIMEALRHLGSPEWSIIQITDIRKQNMEIPISERSAEMAKFNIHQSKLTA